MPRWLLPLLLGLCIVRLWLLPLGSSFWLDEMATVFVARYGSHHPSLAAAAPQAWQSLYYSLIRANGAIFGFSEIACRMPSILAMGGLLILVARLAARLIHPGSGWFAVFACLALGGLDYSAADARPYALGMLVIAASLLFLIRWLDSGRWLDALLFIAPAALVWRIHLLFWPCYAVFALYAAVRVSRRQTMVGWGRAACVFGVLGLALLPVLADALALLRQARAHVIAPSPSWRQFAASLKLGLILFCGGAAWLLSRGFGWQREPARRPPSALVLIAGWWLSQPALLFAFSRQTGDSVFVPRYLAVSLPGTALAITAATALNLPARQWRLWSAVLGLFVLSASAFLWAAHWQAGWPLHHNSDWRAAARTVNELEKEGSAPVVCPSPFVEAVPPAWRPDYPLPGFLYAHLPVYPIRGRVYLFPFENSPEAGRYAESLVKTTLAASPRFVVYGWEPQVHFWRDWLGDRPELRAWRQRRLGPFADVDVVVFEPGGPGHG